jgi:hypothetical protein
MKNKLFSVSLLLTSIIAAPFVSATSPTPGKINPKVIKGGIIKPVQAPPPGYIEGILIKPKTYIADGKSSVYIYATGIGVCDDLQVVYGGSPQSKTKKNYDLNAHTQYVQGMPSVPGTYTIEVRPGPTAKRCKGRATGTIFVKKPMRLTNIPRNLFK